MTIWTPRAFQPKGVAHITENRRAALHVGCGMGKTSMTVAAIDLLMLAGETERTLVCAPKRVARATWAAEVAKWEQFEHLRVVPIIGDAAARRSALRQKGDIWTINYENLPWLYEQVGKDWPFDTVVADEATKLKGFRVKQGSTRARALGRVTHRPGGIRRFIELTGTPAANGLKDLWGQMWFLDGGRRLGRTYTAFQDRWFQTGRDGFSLEPLPHAFDEITGLIGDLCLSMQAEDYFDLPDQIENTIEVELDAQAMRQYREMEREMFLEIADTGVEAFNAAAKTGKCLQLANGAIYLDDTGRWAEVHKAKLEALESIVEESAGKPLIVAYQFQSDLARLLKHFPQARVLDTVRDEDDFKAGKVPLLLCHPDSAGHGIDGFQYVTNEMVFFGFNWNLETRQQIIERIGPTRQAQAGNTAPVVIHNIVARGTIDELVLERIETKASVQDLLLKRMKR